MENGERSGRGCQRHCPILEEPRRENSGFSLASSVLWHKVNNDSVLPTRLFFFRIRQDHAVADEIVGCRKLIVEPAALRGSISRMPIKSRPALLAAELELILDQRAGNAPPPQLGSDEEVLRDQQQGRVVPSTFVKHRDGEACDLTIPFGDAAEER